MKVAISNLEMKPHPKFEGVRIGFVVTKELYPELSITVLEIEPQVQIPIHTHEREVDSIFVLSGEGEVYLEGKWSKIQAGDVVVVAPKKEHGVRNTGKVTMRCYIVHAPALW
ncbi:MAG: cupin domain-containing protein [Caldimicrobium sp.]|nr:cupin domain-containing protein [Caldimicrobium sp.]MCX7872937.1 cupin domain-containing protein [Caldimicrobium sp.]MDW8094461.1 cupin domain-containing protein [Caldimicrobium sp.]